MAFKPSSGLHTGFDDVIAEISGKTGLTPLHLMVNILPPGLRVPEHRDWLAPSPLQGDKPCLARWHLALDDGVWWDSLNGSMIFLPGYWYGPMPYWKYHSVSNESVTPRTNIIVDLDTEVRLGLY